MLDKIGKKAQNEYQQICYFIALYNWSEQEGKGKKAEYFQRKIMDD